MINNDFNPCALITGSCHRIGKDMAIFLAQKGFDIVIHYNKSEQSALELANLLSTKYHIKSAVIGGDLMHKSSAKNIADFMFKNFPNWNLLINNASIFNKSNFIDHIDDEFENNLSIHLISPVYLSHYFAKNVITNQPKNPHIINMIDKNIARYETKNFYYLLSKKFLAEFTKMLALELAPNIRVNAIAPGFILPDKECTPQDLIKTTQLIPLKKIGEPKNIVQTLEFLLNNDFVNGQIISIDGGASLNHAG